MSGKQGGEEPNIDDFEFYLAEDLVELDLDLGSEAPTEDDLDGPEPARPVDLRPTADRSHPSALERGVVGKKMTAMEALAAAMQAEANQQAEKEAEKRRKIEAVQQEAERQKKAELARKLARDAAQRVEAERLEREEQEAAEAAEWARAAFGGSTAPGKSVAGTARGASRDPLDDLPEGAEVEQTWDAIPAKIAGPLMAAHKARAEHSGDLAEAMAFAAIERAIQDSGSRVHAARVRFGDTEWAVWMDADRVIAVLQPAALYLVGL